MLREDEHFCVFRVCVRLRIYAHPRVFAFVRIVACEQPIVGPIHFPSLLD